MSYLNNDNIPEKMSTQKMQSDRPLLIAVIFLVVIGLMAIFSASAAKCIDMGLNPARFLIQQIFGVFVGVVGLVLPPPYDLSEGAPPEGFFSTVRVPFAVVWV